jgi:hypothetical protein
VLSVDFELRVSKAPDPLTGQVDCADVWVKYVVVSIRMVGLQAGAGHPLFCTPRGGGGAGCGLACRWRRLGVGAVRFGYTQRARWIG